MASIYADLWRFLTFLKNTKRINQVSFNGEAETDFKISCEISK